MEALEDRVSPKTSPKTSPSASRNLKYSTVSVAIDDDDDNDSINLWEEDPATSSSENIASIIVESRELFMMTPPKSKPSSSTAAAGAGGGDGSGSKQRYASNAISPIPFSLPLGDFTPNRHTVRTQFNDDSSTADDEAFLHDIPLDSNTSQSLISPSRIVPMDRDLASIDILSSSKSKPSTPLKLNSKTRGEALTPDKALQFMIKERQDMDIEYANLRKQNSELKDELNKKSSTLDGMTVTDAGIKKVPGADVLKNVLKWKAESERVQSENDLLKRQLRENELKMRLHYEGLLLARANEATASQQLLSDVHTGTPITPIVPIAPSAASPSGVSSVSSAPSSTSKPSIPSIIPTTITTTPSEKVSHQSAKVQLNTQLLHRSERPILDVHSFLWDGTAMWKVPFSSTGFPERRIIRIRREFKANDFSRQIRVIDHDGYYRGTNGSEPLYIAYPITLEWYKSGDEENCRELVLNRDAHVITEHNTPAFWRLVSNAQGVPKPQLCFSIVSHIRTLDLIADSSDDALEWTRSLEQLFKATNGKILEKNFKRDKFSFRGEDVETDYVPQHSAMSSSRVVKNRTRGLDAESLRKLMFTATSTADYDLLQEVLEAGMNVNLMEPSRNDSPLMIACRSGSCDIIRLCLHYGAKNDPHPDFGHTALHVAVMSSQLDAATILLEAAASSNADSIIANLADPSGQTPLHVACEKGLMSMIEVLLCHGVELNRRDGQGRLATHICAALGHKRSLALILDQSADLIINEVDKYGNSALHLAAESGQLGCTQLLLETAADVHRKNFSGKTAYMLANAKGHYQIAQLILEYSQSLDRSSGLGSKQSSWSEKGSSNGSSPNLSSSVPFFLKPQVVTEDLTLPRPHQPSPRLSRDQLKNPSAHSGNESGTRYSTLYRTMLCILLTCFIHE